MSNDQTFQSAWIKAVADYESHTGRKLDKDSAFKEFNSLEDLGHTINSGLGHTINSGLGRFSTFRGAHRK